jgi:endonuclease G, mitochondrial
MPYQENFLTTPVPLPVISGPLIKHIAPLLNGSGHVLHYKHHSVVVNKKRGLAFYSASNINGKTWKKIDRSGSFKKDKKIAPDHQWGDELYDAIKGTSGRPNDFEEGHLTSFQEVLWGTAAEIKKAAADTFYFPNCVPQHERVNSGLWRSLEQYVLKKETVDNELKVSVFTGPVLSDKDPYYIQKINGTLIQIPCAFWKVIYYNNSKGLNAVGFMMAHKKLLLDDGTVTYGKSTVRGLRAPVAADQENYFMDYDNSKIYQVKVEFIQKETDLKFMLNNVTLPFTEETKRDLLYKRIDVSRTRGAARATTGGDLDYDIQGISL